MNEVSYIQLQRWLKLLKAPVSKGFLRKRLFSHPSAESLLSITDTLDELGIDNAAIEIDKDRLKEIRSPFLAHLDRQGGRFAFMKDVASAERYPGFFNDWSGIIVLGEPDGLPRNEENIRQLSYERELSVMLKVLMCSAAAWIIFSVAVSFSILHALLVLTSVAGLATSFLIYQKERGVASDLLDKFCTSGKAADCDAVLESNGATLFSWLKFSDVGLIYFFTQLAILTTAFAYGNAHLVRVVISLPAVPASIFTLYSLYYQAFVVRKWCKLCLIIVGVLMIQMVLLANDILLFRFETGYMAVMLMFLAATGLVSGAWLLLQRLMGERKSLESSYYRSLRFKYDPGVFVRTLQQQRAVDTTPFRNELQLGDPDAAVQLTVICNPYCKPCSKAHKLIDDLLEAEDCSIGVAVRFNVDYKKWTDRKTNAARQILRTVWDKDIVTSRELKRAVINDWFKDMSFDRFTAKYGSKDGPQTEDEFYEQARWAGDVPVEYTPTVFINGYQLPREYSIYDLPVLVRGISLSDDHIKTS